MAATDMLSTTQFGARPMPGIPVDHTPPLPPGRSPHTEAPYIHPVYPTRTR